MSQEGVDKLRRGYEVLNREGVDAALNLGFIDPDIVVRASQDLPDTDIYRGHDGMRRLLGMFSETFDDVRLEPEEFRDLGDRYLVGVRTVGRGKGSSVPIDDVAGERGADPLRVRRFESPRLRGVDQHTASRRRVARAADQP